MTRFSSQLLGSAALSLVLGAPTALANPADAADDDVYVQDEIVVVGQHLYSDQVNALKTPTPIIDVPQSLTIVTADQILERGFDSVADIVTYTPGVNATQGEGHRDAIVFRGVRSTADFFVDGVRDDVQYYRPLYNLEQVEILRGPNALLFGRGGTGGVLNRVTKKGDLDETFTGYQASIDSFGGFGGSVDTNFVVADNAALRIRQVSVVQDHKSVRKNMPLSAGATVEPTAMSARPMAMVYQPLTVANAEITRTACFTIFLANCAVRLFPYRYGSI